jgi:hypothetical protein
MLTSYVNMNVAFEVCWQGFPPEAGASECVWLAAAREQHLMHLCSFWSAGAELASLASSGRSDNDKSCSRKQWLGEFFSCTVCRGESLPFLDSRASVAS